jgi:hypothetical protein
MCTTDICHVWRGQVRVGFHGGEDLWVEDVLNIGVDPRCADWACLCFSPCSGVAQSRYVSFLQAMWRCGCEDSCVDPKWTR